jgi:plastocyanin
MANRQHFQSPLAKPRWLALALLAAATSRAPAQEAPAAGRIEGVVRFTGAVPAPEKIITSDGMVLMHRDLVVDDKSKGLRHVAAYLDGAPARPLAKDAKMAVVDQRDMIFIPRVIAVQEGQKVRFDNNDLCNHAVMSAAARSENIFNVLTPMGQPFDIHFQAEKKPLQIGCPIHTWMRAWVYVLPHPWFAVSDAQGSFRIDSVPPGTHRLVVVHPDTGLRENRAIEVVSGKTTRVTVEWSKSK